jgi:heat-inducible transcriptional repressor
MTARPAGRSSEQPPGALSERDLRVLSVLVREYIERGEPVSSLWLAEHSGVHVSSATLRNVLARLEEAGFVHQPHTSAGRIPTDMGYRSYVDLLLQGRRPPRPPTEARVRLSGTFDGLLDTMSQELSRTAHHLAFALAPVDDQVTLRHVEFVALDASRVLAVLVAESGQVWHKLLSPADALSPRELAHAASYLNQEFAGRRLADIRSEIVVRLHRDRALYNSLVAHALRMASNTLDEVASEARLFVHGASTLVEEASEAASEIPLDRLRAVFAMIEEKHRLVSLLQEYMEGPGLTVVIGAEHHVPDLRDFSLVASTHVEGGRVATVGVLGPRRMRYSRAIAAVEGVSQAVGRLLPDASGGDV